MTEFLKDALSQIPLFISNFPRAFAQPRSFARQLFADTTAKAIRTTKTTDAIVFFAICLLITGVLKAAVFGSGGVEPNGVSDAAPSVSTLYLAKDAVWKAVIVMAIAGVMRVSWRAVGGRAPYEKYVIANCYYFGVLLVLAHIFLLVATSTFGKLQGWSPLSFMVFCAIALGPLFIWCLYCWTVYQDLNGASLQRAAFAFLIMSAIAIPVLVFSYALRFALIGHVYRDFL